MIIVVMEKQKRSVFLGFWNGKAQKGICVLEQKKLYLNSTSSITILGDISDKSSIVLGTL